MPSGLSYNLVKLAIIAQISLLCVRLQYLAEKIPSFTLHWDSFTQHRWWNFYCQPLYSSSLCTRCCLNTWTVTASGKKQGHLQLEFHTSCSFLSFSHGLLERKLLGSHSLCWRGNPSHSTIVFCQWESFTIGKIQWIYHQQRSKRVYLTGCTCMDSLGRVLHYTVVDKFRGFYSMFVMCVSILTIPWTCLNHYCHIKSHKSSSNQKKKPLSSLQCSLGKLS